MIYVTRSWLVTMLLPRMILLVMMLVGTIVFLMLNSLPEVVHGVGVLLYKGGLKQITSPYSAVVVSYTKEEGDYVNRNDIIAFVRPHNSYEEKPILAHHFGVIAEIIAYPDSDIIKGHPMVILTDSKNPQSDLEMIGFVASLDGKKITQGMKVLVTPSIVDPLVTGYMLASVSKVGKLPMSKSSVQSLVKIPELGHYIKENLHAEPFMVMAMPLLRADHITGYAWSGPGPNIMLDSGIIAHFKVIIAEDSLLKKILPFFTRFKGE